MLIYQRVGDIDHLFFLAASWQALLQGRRDWKVTQSEQASQLEGFRRMFGCWEPTVPKKTTTKTFTKAVWWGEISLHEVSARQNLSWVKWVKDLIEDIYSLTTSADSENKHRAIGPSSLSRSPFCRCFAVRCWGDTCRSKAAHGQVGNWEEIQV